MLPAAQSVAAPYALMSLSSLSGSYAPICRAAAVTGSGLYISSGPVRRKLRRASNGGGKEPSLARPHFVVFTRLRYSIVSPM